MEKPIRPKKPKLVSVPMPQRELCSFYYPMTRYIGDPRSLDAITFYSDNDIPENPWEMEEDDHDAKIEAENFHDTYSYSGVITVSQLMSFAEQKNIPLEELAIATSRGSDSYSNFIEIRRRKQVSDEDYQSQMEAYQAEREAAKSQFQAALAQWQLDKEQYKIDKAAYDLYRAQQKLNFLQS